MKKYFALLITLLMLLSLPIALPTAAEEIPVWDGMSDTSWYNTTDTSFEISTAAQLAGLADIVNGEADVPKDNFAGKTITLTADISLNTYDGNVESYLIFPPANSVWNPIGKYSDGTNYDFVFSGTFDGNYHIVSGLYLYDWNIDSITGWYKGLFGCVENGTVKNLGVVNTCIRGYNGASPLIAYTKNATVENCFTSNTIVYGNAMLGGLVGNSENSTIRNCFVTDAEFGDAYRWGFGNVASIVGKMSGGTLANCYCARTDTAASTNKGVQGDTAFLPTDCYYEAETDGTAADYNGLSKTIDSMKQAEFATLLNSKAGADDIWQADIDEINGGLPVLTKFDYTLLAGPKAPETTEPPITTEEPTTEPDDTDPPVTTDEKPPVTSSGEEADDTSNDDQNSPLLWIVIAVAAAVVVIVVVVVLVKRKK